MQPRVTPMLRSRCRRLAVTALFVTSSLLGAPADAERPREVRQAEGIPPVIFVQLPLRTADFPMFVSSAAAITDEGEFNADLFAPSVLRMLDRYPDRFDPVAGCIVLEEFYEEWAGSPDRSSIEKAAQTAELVLTVEVVGRDFGFQHMVPGQLLRVRPERVLKGRAPLSHYFIFLPIGTFESGPYKFCKTDSRYPQPPEIGERVLLLVPVVGASEEHYLDLRTESSIVTIVDDGSASLPRPFERSRAAVEALPFDALVDRVTASLRAEEDEK
jgi:hypothetical protein